MFVVGELGATINADTDPFEAGLKSMRKGAEKTAQNITKDFFRETSNIGGSLQNIDLPEMPNARDLALQLDLIEYRSQKAEKQITRLGTKIDKDLGGANLSGLDNQIEGINQSLLNSVPTADMLADNISKAGSSGRRAASGLQSMTSSTKGTTMAVTNFNRVLQDAPYGMMGVANNLEPMIQSFNNLKSQTGSTTGALKTLLTSAFTGPGALITSVSVASTLMITFGDRLFSAGKQADDSKEMLSGLNNEVDVMVKAMDRLAAVDDPFGIASLQNELTALDSKYSVLENVQSQMEAMEQQRRKLLKQGISDGEIMDQDAIDRAKELKGQINQLSTQYGTYEQVGKKIEDLDKRRLETQQEMNTTQSALNSGIVKEAEARKEVMKQLEEQVKVTDEDLLWADVTLEPQKLDLGEPIPMSEIIPADLGNIGEGMKLDLGKELFPPGSLGAMRDKMSQLRDSLLRATDPAEIKRLQQAIQDTEAALANTSEQAQVMGQELQSVVNGAITSFATTLGNVFTGDAGASGFFNNLLTITADFTNQFGKLLVGAGTAALAFESLLANPVAAIAAGGALIAASTAIKNLLEDGPTKHRAAGGPVTAGQSYVVGESGREMFMPSTNGNIMPIESGGGMGGLKGELVAIRQTLRSLDIHVDNEALYLATRKGQYTF